MRTSTHGLFVNVCAAIAVLLLATTGSFAGAQVDTAPVASDLRALQAGTAGVPEAGFDLACVPLPCKECLYIDTYDPGHVDGAPAGTYWVTDLKHTSDILQKGVLYRITVKGDVSLWFPNLWSDPGWYYFGTPGTWPAYPTPGVTNGKTGWDSEFLFAYMSRSDQGAGLVLPFNYSKQNVSIDGGLTWHDLTAIGGETYNPLHVYQYVVEGQGKQAYFRFCDTGPTNDNYGRFYICIQKLVPCETNTTSSTKTD
jgi:hypothetical protein